MAAILKEDPLDLSVTNRNVSPGVERIVRHCLEKNPERRFQSASDVAFDLEALSDFSDRPGIRRPAAPKPRLAALAPLSALPGSARRPLDAGARPPTPLLPAAHVPPGPDLQRRFAPDGQSVVFAASWDGTSLRALLAPARQPQWSPLNLPGMDLFAVSRSGELAVRSKLRLGAAVRSDPARPACRCPVVRPESLERRLDADWAPDGRVSPCRTSSTAAGGSSSRSARSCTGPRIESSTVGFSPRGEWIAFRGPPDRRERRWARSWSSIGPDRPGHSPRTGSTSSPSPGRPTETRSGSRPRRPAPAAASGRSTRPAACDRSPRRPARSIILDVSPAGKALVKQHRGVRSSRVSAGRDAARGLHLARFHVSAGPLGRRKDASLPGVGRRRRHEGRRLLEADRRLAARPPGGRVRPLALAGRPVGPGPALHEAAPAGSPSDGCRAAEASARRRDCSCSGGAGFRRQAAAPARDRGDETSFYTLDIAGGKPRRLATSTAA
jgi:hypothetical protein